jgi:hypothetical protein
MPSPDRRVNPFVETSKVSKTFEVWQKIVGDSRK